MFLDEDEVRSVKDSTKIRALEAFKCIAEINHICLTRLEFYRRNRVNLFSTYSVFFGRPTRSRNDAPLLTSQTDLNIHI